MYTFIYQHTRIYTAMMYSNCLAAICDHADPSWRSSALGAYRFWRDMGYAYTHIYLHAYTHIGLHTNMYIHTYVCIYIYTTYISLSLNAPLRSAHTVSGAIWFTCMYTFACICMRTYMHMYIFRNIRICIYVHICKYIYFLVLFCGRCRSYLVWWLGYWHIYI